MSSWKISKTFFSAKGFAFWCILCCCCFILGGAFAATEATISADEWTWEAGGITTFHGSIIPDQNIQGAELTLCVETRLEDSGEALFTDVKGEKLKIRKRSETVTADLIAGTEFTYEGEWYIPDEVNGNIAYAMITLRVKDSAGNEVATVALEEGSRTEDAARYAGTPLQRVNQMILFMAIACVLVWGLAIGLHMRFNRKKA